MADWRRNDTAKPVVCTSTLPTMEDSERNSLLNWLETSGQALELRVARAFREAGLRVDDPFYYQDVTSRTTREGDVAVWGSHAPGEPSILLVLECKHTEKREQQWVGVRPTSKQPRSLKSGWQWLSWSGDVLDSAFDDRAIGAMLQKGLISSGQAPCSRILTAHTGGSHNPAWNACRQALSAAFGLGEAELMRHGVVGSVVTGAVMAVVVTTASLRVCQLSAAGELDLYEADHFEVLCESPSGQLRPVLVMNESHIPVLISSLQGFED